MVLILVKKKEKYSISEIFADLFYFFFLGI